MCPKETQAHRPSRGAASVSLFGSHSCGLAPGSDTSINISPSCWTGLGLPSFLITASFFLNAQKCLCMKHHNRGDELDQSHKPVLSLRNQTKHRGAGNDVVPLLSKPLFLLTAVWSDHNGQSRWWSTPETFALAFQRLKPGQPFLALRV